MAYVITEINLYCIIPFKLVAKFAIWAVDVNCRSVSTFGPKTSTGRYTLPDDVLTYFNYY